MRNHYRGINPHLNSLLQTPGTDEQPALWATFHSTHLNNIADYLNEVLPDHYLALTEQSLQVRGIDEGGMSFIYYPRPDVSIFQKSPGTIILEPVTTAQPTWQAAMAAVLEPEERLNAVVIRDVRDQPAPGRIVTRIELLSPSNKPFNANYSAYRARRLETLHSGVPLVEVDYLHETRSPLLKLPIYPDDPDSHPYSISVSDPRPEWEEGQVVVYGFDVDVPVPTVPLPLAGDDQQIFDFDQAYQRSFESRRWYLMIDQTVEPVRFETYSHTDQDRIHRVMNKNAGGT